MFHLMHSGTVTKITWSYITQNDKFHTFLRLCLNESGETFKEFQKKENYGAKDLFCC